MNDGLGRLLEIAKNFAGAFPLPLAIKDHPFDERNIHSELANKPRTFFDDGHYQEAVEAALKVLERKVKRLSRLYKANTR